MDIGNAKYRLGAISHCSAEAIGVPGQRTFRLLLESGSASATIWMEKEHLQQLGTYIHEIIGSLSRDTRAVVGDPPEPEWSGRAVSIDFKIEKLALGHDSASNCFLVVAHAVEEQEEDSATLSFWLTMSQGRELSKEALKVCAAGRPQCFLCGQPINPDGHVCPRANGHSPLHL